MYFVHPQLAYTPDTTHTLLGYVIRCFVYNITDKRS